MTNKLQFLQAPLALVGNLLLLVGCYMLTRAAFYVENQAMFEPVVVSELPTLLRGGLRFDLAAIAYTNALYLILLYLPWPWKERRGWRWMLRGLFVIINSICLASNLADSVYYPFIKRRTTASVFREFGGGDFLDVFTVEVVNHWYLTLLFVVLAVALCWMYRTPVLHPEKRGRYYTACGVGLLLSALACFAGMRGGLDPEQRPLHNGMAREYVTQPAKAVLVQNTPFSIIRTSSKKSYPTVQYFTPEALDAIYTPVHPANAAAEPKDRRRPNVVVILLESFASEYSARLNPYSEGVGYMPFLDSLMAQGLTFETMMANGLSSIDAQASVFASIPMMVESLMSSQATMNTFDGLGNYLKQMGYHTAYFHGADNGSLSIDGFVKACGMEHYYGRNEYDNDTDWDHHWGIWDEPFMQYYARMMTTMAQPFCTGLFTLTSHHPFQIPEAYRDTFPEGRLPIYKTIRYTDHALRRFFETARQQPWYDNTLFVITGDHTNLQETPAYVNDYGRFQVPVLFYHPADSTLRGCRPGIAQQIDILPTVLAYVGYQGEYLAFGNDLLSTPAEETEAVGYINGLYQLVQGTHVLQFDGEHAVALYDLTYDPLLQANLVASPGARDTLRRMERRLKAIVQQYTTRMNENRLSVINQNQKE